MLWVWQVAQLASNIKAPEAPEVDPVLFFASIFERRKKRVPKSLQKTADNFVNVNVHILRAQLTEWHYDIKKRLHCQS